MWRGQWSTRTAVCHLYPGDTKSYRPLYTKDDGWSPERGLLVTILGSQGESWLLPRNSVLSPFSFIIFGWKRVYKGYSFPLFLTGSQSWFLMYNSYLFWGKKWVVLSLRALTFLINIISMNIFDITQYLITSHIYNNALISIYLKKIIIVD